MPPNFPYIHYSAMTMETDVQLINITGASGNICISKMTSLITEVLFPTVLDSYCCVIGRTSYNKEV